MAEFVQKGISIIKKLSCIPVIPLSKAVLMFVYADPMRLPFASRNQFTLVTAMSVFEGSNEVDRPTLPRCCSSQQLIYCIILRSANSAAHSGLFRATNPERLRPAGAVLGYHRKRADCLPGRSVQVHDAGCLAPAHALTRIRSPFTLTRFSLSSSLTFSLIRAGIP